MQSTFIYNISQHWYAKLCEIFSFHHRLLVCMQLFSIFNRDVLLERHVLAVLEEKEIKLFVQSDGNKR